MGQTTSSVGKVISWWKGTSENDVVDSLNRKRKLPDGVTPFIFKKRGSMFFDEDGDLAHEFYCEVTDRKTNRVVMRRCLNNLTPQGDIDLPFPRLHGDFPVILFDTSSVQMYSQLQS